MPQLTCAAHIVYIQLSRFLSPVILSLTTNLSTIRGRISSPSLPYPWLSNLKRFLNTWFIGKRRPGRNNCTACMYSKQRWAPRWSVEGTIQALALQLSQAVHWPRWCHHRGAMWAGKRETRWLYAIYSLFRTLMSFSDSFDLASIFPSHIHFSFANNFTFAVLQFATLFIDNFVFAELQLEATRFTCK